MTEKLLQYIWNYRLFSRPNFCDIEENALEIVDYGIWNHDSGPDFLFAKIKTKDLVLAGNIEFHLKSSDWIFHKHSENQEFNNVILHVVYFHDCEIEELNHRNIPTLELKNYINPELFMKYENMMLESSFIPCEEIFSQEKIPFQFSESALLQKLNEKSIQIEHQLQKYKNDYEAVFFRELAYAFGLKINAEIFRNIAESIPFSIIRKIRNNHTQLQALLYGKAGWLEKTQDKNMEIWQKEFAFLQHKYAISEIPYSPKFLRLRPPNFPTIRLSQFADLLHREYSLFSTLMYAKNTNEIREIFSNISADEYWDNHYTFGKISKKTYRKTLTKDFVDLILINTILPFKYTWMKHESDEAADEILGFYHDIAPEKNSVLQQWKHLGIHLKSALDSQAFLHQYKNFCLPKKCLNCSIGFQLLKENA